MVFMSTAKAQTDSTMQSERVYDFVEQIPEFPGGTNALHEYLASNIVYPQMALDSCITGSVYVKFIVRSDGTVSDVTIMRDIGAGCGEEAVRVVSAMPKWLPGKQNGKPVNVYYKLPLKFVLDDNCKKKGNK
jgi:protein TonB